MTTSFASGLTVSLEAVTDLLDMLSWMRPDNTQAEIDFLNKYIAPLEVKWDKFGNGVKKIGDAPVAWSCHTDTVHSHPGRQLVERTGWVARLSDKSASNCLGADDTAGVWLMCELIKAGRPGTYLFHRAEECGGQGSKAISKKTPKQVEGVQCVIALDRKGNESVITKQWGGRCCSDDFANSLITKLDMGLKIDTGGSFTDSANYTELVGECTNLSVGYLNQHCKTESLDILYLIQLRERLLALDTRDLTFKRKPGEKEVYQYKNYRHHGYGFGYDDEWGEGYYGWHGGTRSNVHKTDFDNYCPVTFTGYYWKDNKRVNCTHAAWEARRKELSDAATTKTSVPVIVPETQVQLPPKKYFRMVDGVPVEYTLLDMVKEHPDEVALLLDDWGFDVPMLRTEINQRVDDANAKSETKAKPASDLVFKN